MFLPLPNFSVSIVFYLCLFPILYPHSTVCAMFYQWFSTYWNLPIDFCMCFYLYYILFYLCFSSKFRYVFQIPYMIIRRFYPPLYGFRCVFSPPGNFTKFPGAKSVILHNGLYMKFSKFLMARLVARVAPVLQDAYQSAVTDCVRPPSGILLKIPGKICDFPYI